MAGHASITADRWMEIIPIHFDVPQNYLPFQEFVDTATATKLIVDTFNAEIFNGGLDFEWIVLPPEEGSFKSRFAVFVKVAGVLSAAAWAAADTDIGKGYIEGLTGQKPEYWAKRAGEAQKRDIEELSEREVHLKQKAVEEVAVAMMLAESTKGFLTKEYNELRKIGISKTQFRTAYQGRNSFYEACYRQPTIRAVGFTENEVFPVKRNDFAKFIVDVPANDEENLEKKWIVEITYLSVTSPNWDRSDLQRTWRGKYRHNGQDKYAVFSIEDDLFWGMLEKHKIKSKGIDNIKVQWAFVEEQGRRKFLRVLKVLEHNGRKVSEPYDDAELAELLAGFELSLSQQREFFDK